MYVIVVGGGKVGYYLSKHLLDRGYEVTLIEKDPRRADVVVAVTGDDEDNLVTCQLAKRKFNVPKTVARVNNPANVRIFKTLGVDVALSATEVLLDLIESELANKETAGRSATQA